MWLQQVLLAGPSPKLLNGTHLGSVTDGQPVLEAWLPETGKPGRRPRGVIGGLSGGDASVRLNLNANIPAGFRRPGRSEPPPSEGRSSRRGVYIQPTGRAFAQLAPTPALAASMHHLPQGVGEGGGDLGGGWGSGRRVMRAKWRERAPILPSPQPSTERVQAVAMGRRPA